jgi:hypothetical protein
MAALTGFKDLMLRALTLRPVPVHKQKSFKTVLAGFLEKERSKLSVKPAHKLGGCTEIAPNAGTLHAGLEVAGLAAPDESAPLDRYAPARPAASWAVSAPMRGGTHLHHHLCVRRLPCATVPVTPPTRARACRQYRKCNRWDSHNSGVRRLNAVLAQWRKEPPKLEQSEEGGPIPWKSGYEAALAAAPAVTLNAKAGPSEPPPTVTADALALHYYVCPCPYSPALRAACWILPPAPPCAHTVLFSLLRPLCRQSGRACAGWPFSGDARV